MFTENYTEKTFLSINIDFLLVQLSLRVWKTQLKSQLWRFIRFFPQIKNLSKYCVCCLVVCVVSYFGNITS